MKKTLSILLIAAIQSFAEVESSSAKTVEEYSRVATVHGMVCAFCSNSLEQKFKKQKKIKKVFVDLEAKKVMIKFKTGKVISDKKLKKMITTSGFKVVSIKSYKNKNKIQGERIDR